jgi:hypothetical protein
MEKKYQQEIKAINNRIRLLKPSGAVLNQTDYYFPLRARQKGKEGRLYRFGVNTNWLPDRGLLPVAVDLNMFFFVSADGDVILPMQFDEKGYKSVTICEILDPIPD